MLPPINILWLKRDLRARDHEPLLAAKASGEPFVMVYCFEPHIMASPKHSPRHWRFVAQSLRDLRERGYPVLIFWGEVTEALRALAEIHPITTLFSHQETGHRLTFLRDRAVKAWCVEQGVDWKEFVQEGVIRGRKHRNGFADHVDAFFARPPVQSEGVTAQMVDPTTLDLTVAKMDPQAEADFRSSQHPASVFPITPGRYDIDVPVNSAGADLFQPGGETMAWRYLRSFTSDRGKGYAYKLGNPSLSRTSCSRMSTYLAYGCVSVKEVFQWAKRAAAEHSDWTYDLKMFRERLWWRAHYFQKLEAEWEIEFEPMNRAMHGLGRISPGPSIPTECGTSCLPACVSAQLEAFKNGQTGFPMIDANIRCLKATGWINFRSRAMLVTFATFVLWLDWKPIAVFLGSQFLDYDPGIHYGQFQMQTGMTGYHPPRNYNPYLQGEKYDKEGEFVHKWLPQLRAVPAPFCHYPHRLTALEKTMYGYSDETYPHPIVDYATAASANMDKYWAVRNSPAAQGELVGIWLKHVLPESRAQYMQGVDPSPRRDV